MKNILQEKPSYELNGRLLESVNFVQDIDLQDKWVLDIGCGFGWCELNFLKRGVKKVISIEISENDLKTAVKHVKNEKVRFCVAGAVKLPFKDNSFASIVCWEVLEHLPKNKEKLFFDEINRVLTEDGIFYMSTPFRSFFSIVLDPAWWLLGHRHYSKAQLINYGKDSSFDIANCRVKGGLWSLGYILNMYFSKWILRRKPLFQNYFIKKENYEYSNKAGFANIFMKYKRINPETL